MIKKMFKIITSLLLTMALLLMPCFSTIIAAEEGAIGGSISENNRLSENENVSIEEAVSSTVPDGTYGGYYVPDGVLPNPDYELPEENTDNLQSSQIGSMVGTNATVNAQPIADGVYCIQNMGNGKYMNTNNGGFTEGTQIVQWDSYPYINGDTSVPNR